MAGIADWSIAVGILVFIVAVVIAAIYYWRFKKIFIVVLTASIATYIFAVFYTWDVFELKKNSVLAMLVVSTIVMIFLGKYFSKIQLKNDKPHTSLKESHKK